jgi:transposase-like protein
MSSQTDDLDLAWAVHEFAEADLGDMRRTKRLVERAHVLAPYPTAPLPEACGDGAMLKAAYRFFANDDSTPHDCLASPIISMYRRLDHVPVVLAVHDTTDVTWTSHRATTGLGPLGHVACQGLHVHSPLAFTPERVPLRRFAQQVGARDPDDVGKRQRRHQVPIPQKESQPWLPSLEAASSARQACTHTRVVSVGDREADVLDLLAAERPAGLDLLVRAAWDRWVDGPERAVWAPVEAHPVLEPRRLQGLRRGAQPGREAMLALRFCPLTLYPPRHRKAEGFPGVTLWAVQGRAMDPPPDVQPIAWLLLTSVAVQTAEDARERVGGYACRWGIEIV